MNHFRRWTRTDNGGTIGQYICEATNVSKVQEEKKKNTSDIGR